MKQITLIAILVCNLSVLSAQKFAYVDSKYILSHLEEYMDAQDELDREASAWQEEIEEMYESVARLEESFRAESVLLTDEMKTARRNAIDQKKMQARELQKQRFGIEGDLFAKRQSLVQPIQEKVYAAIKKLASQKGYMVVFDKSNQSNMLYTNPKYDRSDDVVRKLGLKPGDTFESKAEGEGQDSENNDGGSESPKSEERR